MEDKQIIELYFNRNEQAITETGNKYGTFCHRIAMNILCIHEDAEECVNDTYFRVWNQIPPTVPESFRAFLGRIVRNLSISRYRQMRAKKRYSGLEVLLSELEDCVPSSCDVEQVIERNALSEMISDWLDSLPEEDSVLFVRRYWFGDENKTLAQNSGKSVKTLTQKLYRMRKSLKSDLEKKGVAL